jgi:hypothetical protein
MAKLRSRTTGLCAIAWVVALATCSWGAAQDEGFSLELTGSSPSFTFSESAAWGWWDPPKYADWVPTADDGFGFVEGRAMLTGETYSVVFTYERVPSLRGAGDVEAASGTSSAHADLTTDIEIYDLAIAQAFGHDEKIAVMPWFGATRLVIDERRVVTGQSGADSANSSLWGAAAGADALLKVASRWAVSGRVVFRWAEGTRDGHVRVPESGPQLGTVAVSDRISRVVYGGELGVRWIATSWCNVEGGWRIRDWRRHDGPGSYDGPYVRLVLGL